MKKIFMAVIFIIVFAGSAGVILAEEKAKVEIAAPGAAEQAKSAPLPLSPLQRPLRPRLIPAIQPGC